MEDAMNARRTRPRCKPGTDRKAFLRAHGTVRSLACGVLGVVVTLACGRATAQALADPAAGAASSASRAADESNRPSRIEERIQHGFFGDLSRPAVPALNRIDGIRIPAAQPPDASPGARPASKPAAPSASGQGPIAAPPALKTEPDKAVRAGTPGQATPQPSSNAATAAPVETPSESGPTGQP
jgi:hypothetical protein